MKKVLAIFALFFVFNVYACSDDESELSYQLKEKVITLYRHLIVVQASWALFAEQ
jgi:hypothetical protein